MRAEYSSATIVMGGREVDEVHLYLRASGFDDYGPEPAEAFDAASARRPGTRQALPPQRLRARRPDLPRAPAVVARRVSWMVEARGR